MERYVECVSRGLTLRGMLHVPDGREGKLPFVILFHGFCDDRNEINFVHTELSRRLCERGIASVRFDFAGSGESDGRFEDMTVSGEVADGMAILDYVKGMAFRYGIRVFLINPKNTSRLAYDGSGEVVRDHDNFSLCTFATGKRYDCDLGASYNIGARYFLRAMEKAMASEPWERLKAEVPGLATRTECTLFTLWKVSALLYGEDMSRRKAAA